MNFVGQECYIITHNFEIMRTIMTINIGEMYCKKSKESESKISKKLMEKKTQEEKTCQRL